HASRNQGSAQGNGKPWRKIHALCCVADQHKERLFLFDYCFQNRNVRIRIVVGELLVFCRNNTIDFPGLELTCERPRIGAHDDGSNRLAEIAAYALGKNQQFGCDRLEFVIVVLGDDKNHYNTLASFLSFSTRVAAASSGVPLMISTLLFRSGTRISCTSYIAPDLPTASSIKPRSAADHGLNSFFFAAMMPFNDAYRG